MIYLSDEQRQALEQSGADKPLPVYDARNGLTYFLVSALLYERVRGLLEEPAANGTPEISPGIRRSKEAFLRDLPELLRSWWYRGKWVAYHGDKQVKICRNPEKLIRECVRQGLRQDEYYIGKIRPHDPEPVEIEARPTGTDWDEDAATQPT